MLEFAAQAAGKRGGLGLFYASQVFVCLFFILIIIINVSRIILIFRSLSFPAVGQPHIINDPKKTSIALH